MITIKYPTKLRKVAMAYGLFLFAIIPAFSQSLSFDEKDIKKFDDGKPIICEDYGLTVGFVRLPHEIFQGKRFNGYFISSKHLIVDLLGQSENGKFSHEFLLIDFQGNIKSRIPLTVDSFHGRRAIDLVYLEKCERLVILFSYKLLFIVTLTGDVILQETQVNTYDLCRDTKKDFFLCLKEEELNKLFEPVIDLRDPDGKVLSTQRPNNTKREFSVFLSPEGLILHENSPVWFNFEDYTFYYINSDPMECFLSLDLPNPVNYNEYVKPNGVAYNLKSESVYDLFIMYNHPVLLNQLLFFRFKFNGFYYSVLYDTELNKLQKIRKGSPVFVSSELELSWTPTIIHDEGVCSTLLNKNSIEKALLSKKSILSNKLKSEDLIVVFVENQ